MFKWKVCPIQGRQLKDVRKEDLFENFRICDTYRGGGGYDKFPEIASRRIKNIRFYKGNLAKQFVVQLYGCVFDCPYCYVTRDGVWGETVEYNSTELVMAFRRAQSKFNTGVFHLMGGAPAIYLEHWPELLNRLGSTAIFHSDLLLVEKEYDFNILKKIDRPNTLYAVNFKGVTPYDYYKNTGKRINWGLMFDNLDKVYESGLNFYITFTNPNMQFIPVFKNQLQQRYGFKRGRYINILEDNYTINLNWDYEALKEQ